jgi:hypothetical protein
MHNLERLAVPTCAAWAAASPALSVAQHTCVDKQGVSGSGFVPGGGGGFGYSCAITTDECITDSDNGCPSIVAPWPCRVRGTCKTSSLVLLVSIASQPLLAKPSQAAKLCSQRRAASSPCAFDTGTAPSVVADAEQLQEKIVHFLTNISYNDGLCEQLRQVPDRAA